ncbi:hypothetical protein K439DRAFT_1328678 [Ramaria rubella]|nr:hypothetical protein K439DRAFT_1328678 [Ramaria rubella]
MAIPAETPADRLEVSSEEEEKRQKSRKDAIKKLTEIRRAFAWPLHRVPLEKRLAATYVGNRKAKLILPRSYRCGEGEDTKFVRSDEDLNMIVHHWYEERVENTESKTRGVNFVTKDGIISKKHEYLGPDPRVAGYEVGNDGNIRIRWWDGFLEDQWVGKEKWKVDVVCNDNGEWVETLP